MTTSDDSLLIGGQNHLLLFIDRSKVGEGVCEKVTHGREQDEGRVPVPWCTHGGRRYLHSDHPSLQDLLMHRVHDLLLAFLLKARQSDHLDLLLGADDGKVGRTVVWFRNQLVFDLVWIRNGDSLVIENEDGNNGSGMEKRVVLAWTKERGGSEGGKREEGGREDRIRGYLCTCGVRD